MTFDLKFLLTILLAIAGVVVPIWLWQHDINANSLRLKISSSTALQQDSRSQIPDLVVMLGDLKVESPYLSVAELVNDGSKPIPSSNFEGPIEISTGPSAKILRARASSGSPADVSAQMSVEASVAKIQPLLLNPGDSLRIVIFTAGAEPSFVAKSRIAGISSITVEDATPKPSKWKALAFQIPVGIISTILYFVFMVSIIRPDAFSLSRPIAAAIVLICLTSGSATLTGGLAALGFESSGFSKLLVLAFSAIVGVYLSYRILRRNRMVR